MNDRTKIIELNDQFRTTFKGGRVQMTPAVYALDLEIRNRAFWAVSMYCTFAEDDEHASGVIIFAGHSFEWRIEYRRMDGTGVSLNPADPEQTFRILILYTAADIPVRSPSISLVGITGERWDEPRYHEGNDPRSVATCRDQP